MVIVMMYETGGEQVTRTTLDLDPGLIQELKHLAARGRESMSRTANRLLRDALQRQQMERYEPQPLRWHVAEGATPARLKISTGGMPRWRR